MINITWRVVGKENETNLQNDISRLSPQKVHILPHIMSACTRF